MAVELAPGLGGVALFTAPGLAVCGLAPGLRRLPLPRRLAYAYLLGVATVGGGLYALSHLAGVPLRRPAILAVAAAPVLAGLAAWGARLWRRDRGGKERRAGRVGRWPWRRCRRPFDPGGLLVAACAVIAAAVCLGVLLDAVTDPVKDWDGRMTWCAQARYVRAAATVDAAVLREGQWFITHPQYPLLLPLAQVAEMEVFGTPDDGHAFRALYAAFLPALLLVAYDGARRWAGRAPAALVTLAASLIPFMMKGEGGANSAYSDLPLACFYGAGLLLLLAGRARSGDGLATGLLLGAAVLTKNEGLPYAVLALLLGCVVSLAPRPRLRGSGPARMVHGPSAASGAAEKSGRGVGGRLPLRRLAAAGLPVVLAIALLVAWRAGIPNREDENYPGFVRPADFWPAAFTRLPQVVPVMLSKMYDWEGWTAFWWMAPAVLVAGWRALRRPVARRLLIAAAAPPAMAWAVYSVHWLPTYIASVTWERFLLHGMVPLLVLLAIALADVLRRTGLWSRASS